jgi:hypothetical protein
VYVNWVNGTDYIQNNERVAEAVINWVNAQKVISGSTEPNVILGRSMGGIIARYALKRMENAHALNINAPLHNTRLFISNDGGQQGSNIQQGYQHLANHFRNLYIKTGATANLIETISLTSLIASPYAMLSVNETPASRQLAVNHVNLTNGIDNNLHNSFISELNALGYPNGDGLTMPFRKVVVSNGSECAKPQAVGSGGNLLTYKGKTHTTIWANVINMLSGGLTGIVGSQAIFSPPALFALGTVPGRNDFDVDLAVNGKADGVGNQVYKNKIIYTKKILGLIPVSVTLTNKSYNANASTLAYDYFPGGNQDIATELMLPQSGSTVLLEKNITFAHQPYCHVPVPSALDLGSGTQTLTYSDYFTPYRGSSPPAPPKATPFQSFISAFNGGPDNEPHTQIERRNGDWMAAELNSAPVVAVSCAALCNGTITGSSAICTSVSTYSIPFVSGVTYNWSVQPAGIANMSPSAPPYTNSVQLTRNGSANGPVTLTVTTGTGCPGTLSKPIFVGVPTTYCQEIGNGSCYQTNFLCPSQLNNWQSASILGSWGVGGTGYHLEATGGGYFSNGLTTYDITLNNFSVFVPTNGASVAVWAMNSCGVASGIPYVIVYAVKNYGCFNLFEVDPNPASSEITISPDASITSKEQSTSASSSFTRVQIVDKMGVVKKSFSFQKGTTRATINISFLPADAYIVKVYNGSTWEENKLLVIK